MRAVLDASAAVRVALNASEAEVWARRLSAAELVMAPELLIAEAANAFWKYLRAGHLDRAGAERALGACLRLVDEFVPMRDLCLEAFRLAAAAGRPVYDMFYLVLAQREGATLLTADGWLGQAARNHGVVTEPAGSPPPP